MAIDKPQKTRTIQRPNGWTDVLAPEIIRQFVGKHIAIVYKRVVASGTSVERVMEECLQLFPDETPYLAYIPTPEETLAAELAAQESQTLHIPVLGGADYEIVEPTVVADELPIIPRVPPEPIVVSLIPSRGPVGSSVRVSGQHLQQTIAVHFNGSPPAQFVVESDESVLVTVPETGKSGHVTLVSTGGIGIASAVFTVTPPAPVLRDFVPFQGIAGTKIHINGLNFIDARRVKFDDLVAEFSVISPVVISATVPYGAKSGRIIIENDWDSTTSELIFTIIPPPKVASFEPSTGPVSTAVTICGKNFGGVSKVFVGSKESVSFTILEDGCINAIAAHGTDSGPIQVVTDGGIGASAAPFVVIHPPIVSEVTPLSGAYNSSVLINGENLSFTNALKLGDFEILEFEIMSSRSVRFSIPESSKSGVLLLTTVAGSALSPTKLTVVPPPTVKAFTPDSDGVGAKVMVTGTNLTGVKSIDFNGAPVTKYTVISATFLSVEVPDGAVSGPIVVTTSGGKTVSQTSFTVVPPPIITLVSPNAGSIGTDVVISGENLSRVTKVELGDFILEQVMILSPESLRVTIPYGADNGVFTVVSAGGIAISETSFTIVPLPTITSISPAAGPVGTVITIIGTNLDRASVATINQVKANVAVLTATKAKVFVPQDATTGVVTLMTPYGFCESPMKFEVISASSITAVTPSSGIAGSFVTLNGWGFKAVSAIRFGDTLSPSFTVQSKNSIIAQVPYGAKTADVVVESHAGNAVSDKPFHVTLTVTSIEPATGPSGTTVTVTGVGLSGATHIDFGGGAAEFKVESDSLLTAIAPTSGTDGAIHVETRSGATYSGSKYRYPPEIIGIAPERCGPGTLLAIEVSRNIELSIDDCTVDFSNGVSVKPSYVDLLDHVVYVTLPETVSSGPIRLVTGGGIAESRSKIEFVADH